MNKFKFNFISQRDRFYKSRRAVQLCLVLLLLLFQVMAPAVIKAEEPLPPADLLEWLDYSLKRFPPNDCPSFAGVKRCASVTEVSLLGDLQAGRVQIVVTGYNWSRQEQILSLFGPSSTYALENVKINLSEQYDPEAHDEIFMAPYFDESGMSWKLKVPPSRFKMMATLVFEPKAIMPLRLAEGLGRVDDSRLSGGYIQYDENFGHHGGDVQLVLEGKKQETPDKPMIRVTRLFHWGSIPTFSYVIDVSGLRSETPISIPLLKNEVIEQVLPEKPYTIETKSGKAYFEAVFSPSSSEVKIKGHYSLVPHEFLLGKDLPFEVWIHEADRRYPVNLDTNGKPIDPSEFSNLANINNSKAFMMKPNQKLAFHKVNLAVDEGRQGKGDIEYKFYEGANGFWLEKLFLTAQILGQDRLIIPTIAKPTYAGIGSEGIELFHDDKNQLSVRLPHEGLNQKKLIEVDWNQARGSSLIFDWFVANIPAQNVYLENQKAQVHFRPGVVPLYAWGGSTTSGDLLDQFHLYGFLIGILAFFVCRGLKFSWILSGVVSLLFVGLYLDESFPTTQVLISLIVTLPVVHLKDEFWTKIKNMPIRRRMGIVLWLILFLISVVPLAEHARSRIFEALHPYANQQSRHLKVDSLAFESPKYRSKRKMKAQKVMVLAEPNVMPMDQRSTSSMNRKIKRMKQNSYGLMKYGTQKNQKEQYQVSEWNAKPVSMIAYTQGGRVVKFESHNILPGAKSLYQVVSAGPLLRGLWMIFETGLILWMMAALLVRAKRLFI